MRYRIKNWREFQHYKGRCPPWIKFHSNTFVSKDWTTLSDASKLAMVVCMVVASIDKEGDGSFDGDPDYIRRLAYLDKAPDLTPLVESGFLEVASTCKQKQSKDISSVSVSVSDMSLSLEGGLGETENSDESGAQLGAHPANPEDFVGPVQKQKEFINPIEDFDADVQTEARKFWQLFCVQHHGSMLRNLHSEATHKELRHFAKAITAHGEQAVEKLNEYYKSPPKADKGLAAWQVILKLGLNSSVEAKNKEPPWEAARKQADEEGRRKLAETVARLNRGMAC